MTNLTDFHKMVETGVDPRRQIQFIILTQVFYSK